MKNQTKKTTFTVYYLYRDATYNTLKQAQARVKSLSKWGNKGAVIDKVVTETKTERL